MNSGGRTITKSIILLLLLSVAILRTVSSSEDDMSNHHTDNLVISCIDFRFQHLVDDWIGKNLGTADLVSVAGSAKCIIDEESRGFLLKQIELSSNLHGIKTLIMIDHADCGAYGGSKAFNSTEDELRAHAENMRKAANVVHSQFPRLEIRLFMMDKKAIKPVLLK